uniref:uncharacterized protein LOC122608108 n=1 Tax=Erigeron canadensis TaxID=72917 RepID=UPI001CB9CA5D|nr:uncharacterized protein LOC122608108 [Erigeron canadensis]
MEEDRVGCLKEAFKGFLNCLGLESGKGKEIVNNPAETDPLVEVPSHIDNPTITARSIVDNYNLVTIDEIMKTSGGASAEAHYVDLDGGTNTSLLATRLITSGGGGKTN